MEKHNSCLQYKALKKVRVQQSCESSESSFPSPNRQASTTDGFWMVHFVDIRVTWKRRQMQSGSYQKYLTPSAVKQYDKQEVQMRHNSSAQLLLTMWDKKFSVLTPSMFTVISELFISVFRFCWNTPDLTKTVGAATPSLFLNMTNDFSHPNFSNRISCLLGLCFLIRQHYNSNY